MVLPTGLAITHAMHHGGGPYPATTSAGHTSEGTTAIRRYPRPITSQNAAVTLPEALRDENALGISHKLNGPFTRAPVTNGATRSR